MTGVAGFKTPDAVKAYNGCVKSRRLAEAELTGSSRFDYTKIFLFSSLCRNRSAQFYPTNTDHVHRPVQRFMRQPINLKAWDDQGIDLGQRAEAAPSSPVTWTPSQVCLVFQLEKAQNKTSLFLSRCTRRPRHRSQRQWHQCQQPLHRRRSHRQRSLRCHHSRHHHHPLSHRHHRHKEACHHRRHQEAHHRHHHQAESHRHHHPVECHHLHHPHQVISHHLLHPTSFLHRHHCKLAVLCF